MEYKYEVVEAGNNSSPNNTILEVANIHNLDKTIVMRLNPYLLTTGILRENTKISYKKSDGSNAVYTVPAGTYSYTLIQIANEVKVNTNILIRDNQATLAENCCFAAGDKVLYSVGSMTNDINDFADETYLITEKGQTLTSIAKNKDIDLSTLMALNPTIGQSKELPLQSIILLSVKSVTNNTTVKITEFGIQANTTRTLFVTWEWDEEKNKTKNYEVKWSFMTSDGKWWVANESATKDGTVKVSTYNADTLAVAVKVSVRPSSESGTPHTWSSDMIHHFGVNAVTTPPAPSVEINKYTLTAKVDGLDIITNETFVVSGTYYDTLSRISDEKDVDLDTLLRLNPSFTKDQELPIGTTVILSVNPVSVEFEIVQDHMTIFNNSGRVDVFTGYATYSCDVDPGCVYKVRCRTLINGLYSNWSGYSSLINSPPTTPVLNSIEPTSENDITITWSKINSAETYNVEYVKKNVDAYKNLSKEQYFDNPSVSTNKITILAEKVVEAMPGYVSYSIFGLESGAEYYLRINSANKESGEPSAWSNIETFILGTESESPTTWSSTTIGIVGDSLPVRLYWIHNSEDGSIETYANIRLTVNGVPQTMITVAKPTDKDKKYETSYYELNMYNYLEGSEIQWEVQTAGVLKENGNPVFGKWSIKRTINIYAPPTLSMNLYDYSDNSLGRILSAYRISSFPFKVELKPGAHSNQKPTGYHVSIISQQDYITVDEVGNTKTIVEGTKVYNKYIDSNKLSETIAISAGDVNLVNNMDYIVEATVSMSSGLTATSSAYVKVRWTATTATPYADVKVDNKAYTATVHPYVLGTEEDILLSVYRREFDGTFTKIMSDIPNGTVVTDPHPSLDYARYRIVAMSQQTGAVSFNDIPGVPVKESAIIIQWDEAWRSFDVTDDFTSEQPSYSGSVLKLPYNIDISNTHSPDVSLVQYIGRKRSVSYYGTHVGETATWNTVIPKRDKETLHALRRLAVYMGNVYVREPSGSGYWASIKINFSQKHLDVSIPITINITPVEGGM